MAQGVGREGLGLFAGGAALIVVEFADRLAHQVLAVFLGDLVPVHVVAFVADGRGARGCDEPAAAGIDAIHGVDREVVLGGGFVVAVRGGDERRGFLLAAPAGDGSQPGLSLRRAPDDAVRLVAGGVGVDDQGLPRLQHGGRVQRGLVEVGGVGDVHGDADGGVQRHVMRGGALALGAPGQEVLVGRAAVDAAEPARDRRGAPAVGAGVLVLAVGVLLRAAAPGDGLAVFEGLPAGVVGLVEVGDADRRGAGPWRWAPPK